MTTFLLIRHGETDVLDRMLSGRLPGCHLNDDGRHQADRLADWLAELPLAAIYASPLERTIETAAPIGRRRALEVVPRDDLLEVDCGVWTGRRFEELDSDDRWRRYNEQRTSLRIPGGELISEVQERIVGAMEQLKERHPGEIVALVSHGDVIRAALAHYAGLHLDFLPRLEVRPASVNIVQLTSQPLVRGVNLRPGSSLQL